ncbi:transposase [Vreelandella sp. 2A-K22]
MPNSKRNYTHHCAAVGRRTPLSGRRKALSCDTVPHFTTLASFVSRHADEIEALFEHVLLVCHKQGLLGNELFAIDGCKMSSDASKEWSGTFKEIGRET